MNQQVNLFHPMFRQQRRIFSAKAMLLSLLVAVSGLMSLYGYAAWRVMALDLETRALSTLRDAAAERLLSLEVTLPKRLKSQILETELARVSATITEQQGLVQALTERLAGEHIGFSGFLAGLARQHVDGLWLSGVHLSDGGNLLKLRGSARSPRLVPKLVKQLAEEERFRSLKFEQLTIDRDPGEVGTVRFTLQSTLQSAQRKRSSS